MRRRFKRVSLHEGANMSVSEATDVTVESLIRDYDQIADLIVTEGIRRQSGEEAEANNLKVTIKTLKAAFKEKYGVEYGRTFCPAEA